VVVVLVEAPSYPLKHKFYLHIGSATLTCDTIYLVTSRFCIVVTVDLITVKPS
jgi:hypothetical protein